MLYVAITPWYLWSTLLLAAWLAVALLAPQHLRFRHLALVSLLAAMAFQALAGVSAAAATHVDNIGRFACTMGMFGSAGTVILTLTQAPAVWLLFTVWPREQDGSRTGFAQWLAAWIAFSAIAALMFLRSAALCTV